MSSTTVFCTECGSEIKAEAEICPECGVRNKHLDTHSSGSSQTTTTASASATGGPDGPASHEWKPLYWLNTKLVAKVGIGYLIVSFVVSGILFLLFVYFIMSFI